MKIQIIAWIATGVFGGAIAWVKLHGGKISAWLTVIRDLLDFADDFNKSCSDGSISPAEVARLQGEYVQIKADLGLATK